MEKHVQVNESELKVRLEKAFTTKEMHPAIDLVEELLKNDIIELPWWIDDIIIGRLRNAGVDIKKNGGYYRCIAAYTLLPKMDKLIDFEHKYAKFIENNTFEDENLLEHWFKIVNDAISITVNSIYSDFEYTEK
jgi:hypothetical protein